MHRPFRTTRRLLLPAVVALALVSPVAGATLARDPAPSPTVTHGASVAIAHWLASVIRLLPDTIRPAGSPPVADWARRPDPSVDRAQHARRAATEATPTAAAGIEPVAVPAAKASSGSVVYRGRNRVWIPALGLNRSVAFFACSRNTPLDHVVYRWGCAGSNNVYLMGHASSVFKPLHDAYVHGSLRKGMEVVYADGDGRVSRYAVSWWKVTPPDGDVSWAYAAQAKPSMTLQTCIGANSAYRLVVRLVRTG